MENDDERPQAGAEAVVKVLDRIRKNSNGYGDIRDNYIASIAEDLDMTRPRVHRAVRLLEEYDLVRKERDGRKKLLVLDGFDAGPEVQDTAQAEPIWNH